MTAVRSVMQQLQVSRLCMRFLTSTFNPLPHGRVSYIADLALACALTIPAVMLTLAFDPLPSARSRIVRS